MDITTDPENVGSQRVIEANGGQLLGASLNLPAHGGGPILHYRMALDGPELPADYLAPGR